jgi:HAD superfamily hydrolase (TIGR01509 family)
MTKIKAIIFDMDGVLIDAKEWHYEALNKALALFGFAISRQEHLDSYDGLPTRKKLEMLSSEKNLPKGLHLFINDLKQLYTLQIANVKCSPLFIHEYALARLKAEGYLLGVASNSVKDSVELMMGKSHLHDRLDVLLSNEDVDQAKPAPDMYIKAAAMLKLKPEECLVIEDNQHGIAAARAAGAKVMAVAQVTEVNYQNIMAHIKQAETAI